MDSPPRWLRWIYAAFSGSTLAVAGLSILLIWKTPEDPATLRVLGTFVVLLLAFTFILAGYRTLHLTEVSRRREDG